MPRHGYWYNRTRREGTLWLRNASFWRQARWRQRVPGKYQGVTIEVKNVSNGNLRAKAFDFSLQDSHGHLLGRAYAQGKENAGVVPLQDDLVVKAGKSETFLLVFKVDEGARLAHLFWQPDGGILVTAANLASE